MVPFIEGDGVGPEIGKAARRVLDAAVRAAYGGQRAITWQEVLAGEKARRETGNGLPAETLEVLAERRLALKGPLATPVGEGNRSVNVALRKALDLYVCLRPVRAFAGVPAPVRHPEWVDMVLFRENTEDIYAGIEFAAGSAEQRRFLDLLREQFPQAYAQIPFPESSGLGLKPISRQGSERFVRAAIRWSLASGRRKLTLVHKGNIMKFTEGAFRTWAYELAEREFGDQVYTELAHRRALEARGEAAGEAERAQAASEDKLIIDDGITDAVFEAVLTRPRDFSVLVTTNLNGDYLSDALAAQVGGLGIAPGANLNFESGVGVFEATHGTAPRLAGRNVANPSSLILSGEMLLRALGWPEAADRVLDALEQTFAARTFTPDLYALAGEGTALGTAEFADVLVARIAAGAQPAQGGAAGSSFHLIDQGP